MASGLSCPRSELQPPVVNQVFIYFLTVNLKLSNQSEDWTVNLKLSNQSEDWTVYLKLSNQSEDWTVYLKLSNQSEDWEVCLNRKFMLIKHWTITSTKYANIRLLAETPIYLWHTYFICATTVVPVLFNSFKTLHITIVRGKPCYHGDAQTDPHTFVFRSIVVVF